MRPVVDRHNDVLYLSPRQVLVTVCVGAQKEMLQRLAGQNSASCTRRGRLGKQVPRGEVPECCLFYTAATQLFQEV